MDCCCRPQEPIIEMQGRQMGTSTITPKLKYSFRTQQATTATRWTNANTVTSFDGNMEHFSRDQKYGLGSTVASNNELIELQRERQQLMQQDKNLEVYYQQTIVPLERQVQFYEQEVKIRSIQIMQLEELLSAKMQEMHYVPSYEPVHIQPSQQLVGGQVFLPNQLYMAHNQPNFVQNVTIPVPVTIRPKPFIQN